MGKYRSIQYLRALAALMVVFFHARSPSLGLYDPLDRFGAGAAGVDIFFVISGFIMYSAARLERPLDFLRRRTIRIAPLYWLATLGLAVFLAARNHVFLITGEATKDVFESLLFIPHYNRTAPAEIWPYLIPGWTLNYEMFFYFVFAIGLVTRRIIAVSAVTLVILALIGILATSHNPLFRTYTDPILLEFLSGILIARYLPVVSRYWSLLLPVGLIAIFFISPFFPTAPRAIIWGIPAAMTVIGALVVEQQNILPQWKFLELLGDASYSIYLFQVFVLAEVRPLFIHRMPLTGPVQLAATIATALVGSTLLGVAAHYALERPVTRFLLSLGRVKRAAPNGLPQEAA